MRPLLADLGRDYRGGQHQALLLLRGLLARGHSPQLIALRDSLLLRRAQDSGIVVHSVGGRWRRIGAMQAIRGLLSSDGIDVIHANEPHALTSAWLARAHRRVPLVASRRVIFPLAKGAISKARYRAAARIIAVSHCVAQQLAASGVAGDKVVLIPDGVTIPPARSPEARAAARTKLRIPAEIPLIGCVGAFTPDKGQNLLIGALGILRARIPDCQVLLAGQGPCRGELDKLVAKEKLDSAVHFTGIGEDLGSIYGAMDVFAFPAQAEALGSSLLLAMAHGLPCVALAHGGITDAVRDGENGVLIQQPNVEELAAAIETVLMNPPEAQRLGAAGRETIVRGFSSDRMIDATLDLYTRLAGRKSNL